MFPNTQCISCVRVRLVCTCASVFFTSYISDIQHFLVHVWMHIYYVFMCMFVCILFNAAHNKMRQGPPAELQAGFTTFKKHVRDNKKRQNFVNKMTRALGNLSLYKAFLKWECALPVREIAIENSDDDDEDFDDLIMSIMGADSYGYNQKKIEIVDENAYENPWSELKTEEEIVECSESPQDAVTATPIKRSKSYFSRPGSSQEPDESNIAMKTASAVLRAGRKDGVFRAGVENEVGGDKKTIFFETTKDMPAEKASNEWGEILVVRVLMGIFRFIIKLMRLSRKILRGKNDKTTSGAITSILITPDKKIERQGHKSSKRVHFKLKKRTQIESFKALEPDSTIVCFLRVSLSLILTASFCLFFFGSETLI